LEAYETLEKEKRLQEESEKMESAHENGSEELVKEEAESPLTGGEALEIMTPMKESLVKE